MESNVVSFRAVRSLFDVQAASHMSVGKLSYSSVYARKMTFIQGYCLG
jgi:hypothetical protein